MPIQRLTVSRYGMDIADVGLIGVKKFTFGGGKYGVQ
jgi:hypothetical protein